MLNLGFMRIAFLVGIFLAAAIPLIGVTITLKRLSMIGDALSHAAMAGILGGLLIGINPVLGAMIASLFGALSIDFIRKKIKRYREMSIAIITSAALGLAGLLYGFVSSSTNFNSFLFGSIVNITQEEFMMVVVLTVIVIIVYLFLYNGLMYTTFDEEAAKLAGIKVEILNFIFTILTAIIVAVASRTVGALIVSSLMVIPLACSMLIAKSYRQTVILAVLFAELFMIVGIALSYTWSLKPGGAIVTFGVIVLLIVLAGRSLRRWFKKKKTKRLS